MAASATEYTWWSDDKPASKLTALAEQLEKRQAARRAQLIHQLRLYGDKNIAGYRPASYARQPLRQDWAWLEQGSRLSLNVVRSCVDSATSQLVQNVPRPTWSTSGGDWSLIKKAKQKTKFADGLFYDGEYYKARRRGIKAMCLFGTGAAKILKRHGKVKYEPTFIGELLVDDMDGVNQAPRQMIQNKVYDREVLKALYPKGAKKIQAEGNADPEYFGRDPLCDQVLVREAWHLPSAPDEKDGRHIIAINSETLFSEPWTDEHFPFVFWRWSDELLGFWGTGLGHELAGIQFEINQLLLMIQQNMYLGGNIKFFLEKGAQIAKSQISNSLRGTIIEYTGTPPVYHVHDVVSAQILEHLRYLVEAAYNITGISQLAAQAQKPAGLNSGRSLLVYANQQSQRFMTVAQNDEDATLDAARIGIEAARQLYEAGEGYTVKYRRSRNWIEEIDIEDVIGDEDEFMLQCFPTSMLPRTPAGKLAMVEQMMAMGLETDVGKLKKLLDFPDLDAETDLDSAPYDIVDERIEMILDEGKLVGPHPYMNLVIARQRAQLAYLRAEQRGADPDRLDMLGQFIEMISDVEAKQAAATPAPAPPPLPGALPPGQPPVAGGAPPVPPAVPPAPAPPPAMLQ